MPRLGTLRLENPLAATLHRSCSLVAVVLLVNRILASWQLPGW